MPPNAPEPIRFPPLCIRLFIPFPTLLMIIAWRDDPDVRFDAAWVERQLVRRGTRNVQGDIKCVADVDFYRSVVR